MKKETKKQLITLLCIFIPLSVFIVFIISGLTQRQRQLGKDPVYTTAIIIDTYVGTKVREFVKYEFVADGKSYTGHQQYFPKIEQVEIGDTCEAVYARTNPEISELLTNKDKSLKIKRKPKELKVSF